MNPVAVRIGYFTFSFNLLYNLFQCRHVTNTLVPGIRVSLRGPVAAGEQVAQAPGYPAQMCEQN